MERSYSFYFVIKLSNSLLLDPGSGMDTNQDPGYKHPGSATLVFCTCLCPITSISQDVYQGPVPTNQFDYGTSFRYTAVWHLYDTSLLYIENCELSVIYSSSLAILLYILLLSNFLLFGFIAKSQSAPFLRQ